MSRTTLITVPGSRRTKPLRTFVLDDDVWQLLDDAATEAGMRNRADLIRALILWWLRMPGAKMPARPPVTPPPA